MFNLSFALVHLYTSATQHWDFPRNASSFEIRCFRSLRNTTENKSQRWREMKKRNLLSGQWGCQKVPRSIKAVKRLPSSILTVLFESWCPNIEEMRNTRYQIAPAGCDYGESQVGRAKRSSYFVFIATLCFLSVEARPLIPSLARNPSFVNPSKRLECHDCFYQSWINITFQKSDCRAAMSTMNIYDYGDIHCGDIDNIICLDLPAFILCRVYRYSNCCLPRLRWLT